MTLLINYEHMNILFEVYHVMYLTGFVEFTKINVHYRSVVSKYN